MSLSFWIKFYYFRYSDSWYCDNFLFRTSRSWSGGSWIQIKSFIRKKLNRNPFGLPPDSRSTDFSGMALPTLRSQPIVRAKSIHGSTSCTWMRLIRCSTCPGVWSPAVPNLSESGCFLISSFRGCPTFAVGVWIQDPLLMVVEKENRKRASRLHPLVA